MPEDVRLHGVRWERIEYFVTAIGNDACQHYFFTSLQDDHLHIFSSGNEMLITNEGISYQGNGGNFCEYMFGVDKPLSDLSKPEIINRLVMFGAHSEDDGSLRFSDITSGKETFDSIFYEGNAVCNYFFFIHSNQLSHTLKNQQEELAKRLGKYIKRSKAVGEERDDILISEMFPLLNDDSSYLFIIKLLNRHHYEYRELFRSLYYRNKKISDADFERLANLATAYKIDRYQQERIRIDAMYRLPANKRIVDEYRNILLACNTKGEVSNLDNARLTRLKTLSLRNKIPGSLFCALDEMLKKDQKLKNFQEQDYIASTREVLEGILFREVEIESRIDRADMLEIVQAKKIAMENHDHAFDQIMLDFSKVCDEKIRDGADSSLLDGLSYVITYLDRFDSVANLISQLAFMENVKINVDMLRGLLEHKAAFDNLHKDSFYELFIRELFANVYLGTFGRRKVKTLMNGLNLVETELSSIEELYLKLAEIDREERLSIVLLEHVRDRIRNFYSRFISKPDQEVLRREVTQELKAKKRIDTDIPDHIFNETIFTIKKEAMYLHSLLPQIVAEHDVGLREDFLENSGLDRFYVEELEREYYEKNGLNIEELYKIRKGLS